MISIVFVFSGHYVSPSNTNYIHYVYQHVRLAQANQWDWPWKRSNLDHLIWYPAMDNEVATKMPSGDLAFGRIIPLDNPAMHQNNNCFVSLAIPSAMYLSIHLSIYLPDCLSISLSLSVCLSVGLSVCLSVIHILYIHTYKLCVYVRQYINLYLHIWSYMYIVVHTRRYACIEL